VIARGLEFIDRAWRVVGRRIDRWAVPRVNARLLSPEPQAVDRAIDRALGWFEVLPGLEFGSITLLKPELDAGLEPRLHFVDYFWRAYAGRFDNPELRLFDPRYRTGAREHAGKVTVGSNHPINDVMLRCVSAPRDGATNALIADIRALEDGGMYGTTHILWAGLLLRFFDAAPDRITDALIDEATGSMLARQHWDHCSDHFAERILFMQWSGQHRLVDPAWITRLLLGQRDDGGWQRHPTMLPTRSIQHTTALALAVLILWRAHVRDGFDAAFWPRAGGLPPL
jgi:hypothetical protein